MQEAMYGCHYFVKQSLVMLCVYIEPQCMYVIEKITQVCHPHSLGINYVTLWGVA